MEEKERWKIVGKIVDDIFDTVKVDEKYLNGDKTVKKCFVDFLYDLIYFCIFRPACRVCEGKPSLYYG